LSDDALVKANLTSRKENMRHIAAIGLVVLVLTGLCAADAAAQGFVYGGPLVFENTTFVNAGISGEKSLHKGLKVVFGASGFGGSGVGGGVFSANAAYHFRLKNEKWEPFATGGVSGLAISNGYGAGGTGGPNFGGGATYWFKENRGFRGEYRVHIYPEVYPQAMHEVRFGFVWKR
jgi:hypothetical protein